MPVVAVRAPQFKFFILGAPRSGTSLLSQMLNRHPSIAVPYESHIFNGFYRWRRLYGDLRDPKHVEMLVDDILATDVMHDWWPRPVRSRVLAAVTRPDFGGVFEAFMAAWAAQCGKVICGEKTPHNVYFADPILHYFLTLDSFTSCAMVGMWRCRSYGPASARRPFLGRRVPGRDTWRQRGP